MENDKCRPALAWLHAIRNAQNRRQFRLPERKYTFRSIELSYTNPQIE